MRLVPRLTICWAVLLLSGALRAQVTLSFPLEGHYRPGRYMPVRVVGSGAGAASVVARGAVPTDVSVKARGDVIVPWLTVGVVEGEHWTSPGDHIERTLDVNLRPLAEDDRLVGLVGDAGDGADALFPGKNVVPVTLNASPRLLDPPIAWEALDAVILSPSSAAQVSDAQRDVLLGAGIMIAVRGGERPDARRDWRRIGDYWVVSLPIAGPTDAIVPGAYEPTYAWDRGWPEPFRRQVVLFAAVVSLLAVAGALLPKRWAVAAVLVVSLGGAAGIAGWYASQSPVLRMSAAVAVRRGGVTQFDQWRWRSPVRPADVAIDASDGARPVFASINQVEQIEFRLVADGATGRLTYRFHLEPRQSLAFRTRTDLPGWNAPPLDAPTSDLRSFGENLYAGGGIAIAGEFASKGERVLVLKDESRER